MCHGALSQPPEEVAIQGPAQDTEIKKVVLQTESCGRWVETIDFTIILPALNYLCCQRQEEDWA